MWDGLGDGPVASGNVIEFGWTLNLPRQGAGFDQAKPAKFQLPQHRPTYIVPVPGQPIETIVRSPNPGAPAALDVRARP
jgi:hypothetical protein